MDRIESRTIWRKLSLIVVMFFITTLFSALTVEGGNDVLEPTRTTGGGEWRDDLMDQTNIVSTDNVAFRNGGFTMDPNPIPVWQDTFESYSQGQNVIGTNGWIYHSSGAHGTVQADKTVSGSPSNTVMVMDNSDYSTNQGVLSSTFNVAKGKIECYLMGNYVWSDDHTSTKIVLHGSTTTSPGETTRLLLMGFNKGSFSYYSATTQSYVNIFPNALSMTWYRIVIYFDCTVSKTNVEVYSTSGTLLGQVQDLPMENNYPSVRRVGINTGRENLYPFQQDFISYIDDVKVYDYSVFEEGEIVTDYQELGDGQFWSTLKVDYVESGGTLRYEFLDGSGTPYNNIDYRDDARETDIRLLNGLGIKGFALRFILSSSPLDSVELRGWSYEWNSSGYYFDGFNTQLLIEETTSNMKLENGKVGLGEHQQLGMFRSVPIAPEGQFYWDSISVSSTIPPDARLYMDLFYGSSISPIEGFTHLTGDIIDISDLDPSLFDNISIRFRFENWSLFGPTVDQFSVHWIPNTDPEIVSLSLADSMHRGDEEVMVIDINEMEQPVDRLGVSIEVKHEMSSFWNSDLIGDPYFNSTSGKWECKVSPGFDAEVGNYSIKVQLMDDFYNLFEYEHVDRLEVMNNLPTLPVIELIPEFPRTVDDLKAVMITASSDADSPSLVYDYRWYLNDEHVSKYDSLGVIAFNDRTFDSHDTMKGDVVTVEVYVRDGLNKTGPIRISRVIQNTPPLLVEGVPENITMFEDTTHMIEFGNISYDIDGDPVEISSSLPVNIEVDIDNEEQSILIKPDVNWFGTERLTLIVSDGEGPSMVPLNIMVIPVNDLPNGSIVSPPEDMEIEIDTRVDIIANASDIETRMDDLDVIWSMNGTELFRGFMFQKVFDEIGVFNISCLVDDGENVVPIGSRIITVIDSTPEYLKDDFKRTYEDDTGAILYDVVDFKGNIQDVREKKGNNIDIITLVSELKGEDLRITLSLGGSPDIDDPTTSYSVFFIRPDWEEPEFDSKLTEADTADSVVPPSGYYFSVGTYGSLGYLTLNSQVESYGDPTVEGNNITWTIPAVMVVNSIDDLEELELYGISLRSSETSIVITKGFDTIGKGSAEHTITDQPGDDTSSDKDDEGISILTIILIVMVLIFFLVIVGLIVVIMRSKNVKDEKKEDHVEEGMPFPAEPVEAGPLTGLQDDLNTFPQLEQPIQGSAPLPSPEPAPQLSQAEGPQNILPGAFMPEQEQPSIQPSQTVIGDAMQTGEPAPAPSIQTPVTEMEPQGPVPPSESIPPTPVQPPSPEPQPQPQPMQEPLS